MVIAAELGELERLAAWASEFGRIANLPSSLLFAIQLCLEEAVANIIMYSGAAEQHAGVAVELTPTGGDVVAIIEDSGRAFDPTAAPAHRKPATLEEAQVGALGIHLMRSFSAAMTYERRDGRNRLTLRFSPARAT